MNALRSQLSWTHLRELIALDDPLKRPFYTELCRQRGDPRADFQNDTDAIKEAFEPFYRTTLLSEETDPNKLHDLKTSLDQAQVYSADQIDQLVILESIDMDSYRIEKKETQKVELPDEEGLVGPVPVEGGGHKPEPELDRLSKILASFNEQFGTLFTDADRVVKRIREEVAPKVVADPAYRNAKLNTPQTAGIELDRALGRVMLDFVKDDTRSTSSSSRTRRSSAS